MSIIGEILLLLLRIGEIASTLINM